MTHRPRLVYTGLALLSGLMLGFSFPPSPWGILACFGLVPLLIVFADCRHLREGLGYAYLAMVVFHALTLNWTGGYVHGNDPYMMIAGTVTIVVHPLFYWIPLGLYLGARRHLGEWAALAALPFLWVGYEFSHSLTEWSFPWLTLGNSQSYEIERIQFISWTGVYGLSFWILLLNVLTFALYSGLARRVYGPRSWRAVALAGGIVLLYVIPWVHGVAVLHDADDPAEGRGDTGSPITVGIVQTNVDPWDKWKAGGFQTMALYRTMSDSLVRQSKGRVDLLLWPETAFPVDILSEQNRVLLDDLRAQLKVWDTSLLTGLPHRVWYMDSTEAPPSARTDIRTGLKYDWFNAAAYLQPGADTAAWYGKMKMVPFAERIPYADLFTFVDFLRWDVGIGGWQIGPDTTVFRDMRTGSRFAPLICYESTYPGFVSAFVRRGAELLVILTIDSWWGRMSGAFQHQRFAVFRAVENRRWVARCAVGGISCYIDPWGRVHDATELFTRAVLTRTITARRELTFYTQHGDFLGEACLTFAMLIAAAIAGKRFLRKQREQLWQSG